MLNILMAILLGFLSGMGIGGGSLLMLYLTSILQMPFTEARGLNLLFFLPCALCASLFRLRKKSLPLIPLLPAIAAGVLSAWFFSRLSSFIPEAILKKAFGLLLLFTGLRELFYRPRKPR